MAKTEMAAEDAAWEALPQAEKDRLNAERATKYEQMFEGSEDQDEEEDEDEEDDEEDDSE